MKLKQHLLPTAVTFILLIFLFSCQANKKEEKYALQPSPATELVKQAEEKESYADYAAGAPAKRALGYMQESPEPFNRDSYNSITENSFRSAKDAPLSTFSIDVDTASYANTRRYINEGSLPPKDAVRLEELINYFSYSYSSPKSESKHPFAIHHELTQAPWNEKSYLLRIGIKARDMETKSIPPRNLVFLLDVSGSMMGSDRLGLIKKGMKLLVNQLTENDRVAIVVYAGAAGMVLEPTPGNDRQKILEALDSLQAGGSTNGGQGIQLAYGLAEKNFRKGGVNRIILATDGDFNVGVSDEGSLVQLIEEKRKSGVFLTVLGFGRGNFQDDRMEQIADKGNGNFAYIDSLSEANKVLVHEAGSTLVTVAKDVKIQVEFNPARVAGYRLIGYENRLLNDEDFNDDTKDAGEIGAGHTVTALYEVIPAGGKIDSKVDPLKYQSDRAETGHLNELATIKVRYKKPDGNKSTLLAQTVNFSTAENPSTDTQFASSVAMFGMLLRDSEYKGTATYDKTFAMARDSVGNDPHGYRSEFVRLVRKAQELSSGSEKE